VADARDRVHATAIAVPDGAVLIRGPSGSGKSDLALRCLALSGTPLCPHPVRLVADDQVLLERRDGVIHATAPPSLHGLLEVRGVGIVGVPASAPAVVRLVVDFAHCDAIERLPELAQMALLGVGLPHLLIAPFEHSAPIKLLLALSRETRAEG
jgi:HPr kinase/phosphorylase